MKNKEIEQVKQEIKVLQSKLALLEEIETREPDMLLMRQGKVDVVDYNKKIYYRIEYTDSFSGVYRWFEREKTFSNLMPIGDRDISYNLENYYLQQVIKQKEEYPYKKYTPEETSESLKQAFREAKKSKEWKDTQKKIDTPIRREEFGDKLIEKLMADPPDSLKFQLGKTLEDVIREWTTIFNIRGDMDRTTMIQDLCDKIYGWLPAKQSSKGTQRIETEIAVDSHNELLTKIKSKIYSKENTL
jgi:hypothetical protein